ncbi:MAG: hypothetical protein LBM99_00090 [Bacillales bacterium]|nr:hypothetical protein [Bacillales bacterium]
MLGLIIILVELILLTTFGVKVNIVYESGGLTHISEEFPVAPNTFGIILLVFIVITILVSIIHYTYEEPYKNSRNEKAK